MNYTLFSEMPEGTISPYIPNYYLCNYNAKSERNFNFPIDVVEDFLEDPNLGILSDDHFYLSSSNKNFVPELEGGVLSLFNNYKIIFDLNNEDNTLSINEAKRDPRFKSSTFSKLGKK